MAVNNPKDLKEKIKRVKTTTSLKEPDRVPILSMASSWCFANAGIKVEEALKDNDLVKQAAGKLYDEVYCDVAGSTPLTANLKLYEIMKPSHPPYLISADGYSMQHNELTEMKPEEYPELIKDPMKFIMNTILPRRYPTLRQEYPKNYEALKKGYETYCDFIQGMIEAAMYVEETYGLTGFASKVMYSPIDIIFDFLRGFKGISMDVRRNTEYLKEAAAALVPEINKLAAQAKSPFPFVLMPLHFATYLGPKKFGEIYWPSFKEVLMTIHNNGGKVCAYLEGNWELYYEFLQELPKGFLVGMMEHDDLSKTKKALGNNMSIVGGMPLELLKYGTKEQCQDHAKKMIDICAPGGGYIFATDKSWLSPGDLDIENYKAAVETVREYGVY